MAFTYETRGKLRMIFPNWNVSASSELTPNIVRAGIMRGPRQNEIQLKKNF